MIRRQSIEIKSEMTSNLKAKAISAGEHHTVVIDLEDNVWSFGHNDYGQLGLGDQDRRTRPEQILGSKADLRSDFSRPSVGKAKAISVGDFHTVVIDLEDNVWTFGRNHSGQLGLGDQEDRSRPEQIIGLKAKAISAGGVRTIVIATLISS